MKYTIYDLARDFPNEAACLDWLFEHKRPPYCPGCGLATHFYPLRKRQAYSCAACRYTFFPRSQTIFKGSQTPLSVWYHAIYLQATNKAGTSAKELERELGVTYKTAWRMNHQIRKLMAASDKPLTGEVEIDETFVHPNPFKRSSARMRYGSDARRKGPIVFGIAERGGSVRTFQVPSTGARTLLPLIEHHVSPGSIIHTDGYLGYRTLKKRGYDHRTTDHGSGQFFTADSSTQNIENVWSHFKRGVKGVYRSIGDEYVGTYAAEYAFRYSYRHSPSIFWVLMSRL